MSDHLQDDILLDYEQEPSSSCADLLVPEIPTLLDDVTTEDLDGPNNTDSNNSSNGSSNAGRGRKESTNTLSIVDEPLCKELVETELQCGRGSAANNARLVIVSWKIRQISALSKALKPGVAIFQYKSDATLQSILHQAKQVLNGRKVISLAFVSHGNPSVLTVSHDKLLSVKSVTEDGEIRQFFHDLVADCIDKCNPNCHLDFLATSLVISGDGQYVFKTLQDFLRIPVTASKDILGTDNVRPENDIGNTGELYFVASILRTWSGSVSQSISNYEKIRTIGRGAYGTAVLYRKKDDDSLVVLKEITILDLSASERQAAMNEVRVLGMLSHPNIVSYYDSFDEDGTLWIEMEYADGGTLSDYLAKQETELEERDILIMFSQMVSAIKYCHDHNILHRDLKTQNIFLTQEFKVKLGDFGIAKIMNTNRSGNFSVVGTPYYISPEMVEDVVKAGLQGPD